MSKLFEQIKQMANLDREIDALLVEINEKSAVLHALKHQVLDNYLQGSGVEPEYEALATGGLLSGNRLVKLDAEEADDESNPEDVIIIDQYFEPLDIDLEQAGHKH